jgi:hypothetical protein
MTTTTICAGSADERLTIVSVDTTSQTISIRSMKKDMIQTGMSI